MPCFQWLTLQARTQRRKLDCAAVHVALVTWLNAGVKGCHDTTSFAALPQKMTGTGDLPSGVGLGAGCPGSARVGAMEKMGPPGAGIFCTSQ